MSASEDLRNLLSSEVPLTPASVASVAADIRDRHEQKNYTRALKRTSGTVLGGRTRDQVASVLRNHQIRRAEILAAEAGLKGAGLGIQGTFTVLGAAALTVPGAVVGAAVGFAVSEVYDAFVEGGAKFGKERAAEIVAKELQLIKDDLGQNLDEILRLPPKDAAAEVSRLTKELYEAPLPEGEARDVAMEFRAGALELFAKNQAELTARLTEAESRSIEELQASTEALNEQSEKLHQVVSQHETRIVELESSVEIIEANVTKLKICVEQNANQVASNKRRLDFLSAAMFDRLPPGEQLRALESGLLGDIPENERAARRIVAQRKKIIEKANHYLDWIDTTTQLASSLGVNDSIVSAARAASRWGRDSIGLYTAVSSGNILGGIQVISGLLMKRADPAQARHEQIMSSLREIEKNQREILRKLDMVLRDLNRLGQLVAKMYEGLALRLDANRVEVLVNRAILIEATRRPLAAAELFLSSRADYGYSQGFPTASKMRMHFNHNGRRWRQGFDELGIEVSLPSVSSLFKLTSYVSVDDAGARASETARDVTERAVRLLTRIGESLKTRSEHLCAALMVPSETYDDMAVLYSNIQGDRTGSRSSSFVAENIGTPVHDATVVRLSEVVAELHHYYELLEQPTSYQLLDFSQVAAPGRMPNPEGRAYATNMARLVLLAIAQEALLSGDLLVPFAYDTLKEWDGKATDDGVRECLSALSANPRFQRNFVAFALRNELRASGHSLWSLDVGLLLGASSGTRRRFVLDQVDTRPAWYFEEATDDELKEATARGTEKGDSGWRFCVHNSDADLRMTIPIAKELADSSVVTSGRRGALMQALNTMLDVMAAYDGGRNAGSDTEQIVRLGAAVSA